jgi:ruvA, C-terminal domain
MLGFQKSASDKVLRKLLKDNPSATVEELVRLALKQL